MGKTLGRRPRHLGGNARQRDHRRQVDRRRLGLGPRGRSERPSVLHRRGRRSEPQTSGMPPRRPSTQRRLTACSPCFALRVAKSFTGTRLSDGRILQRLEILHRHHAEVPGRAWHRSTLLGAATPASGAPDHGHALPWVVSWELPHPTGREAESRLSVPTTGPGRWRLGAAKARRAPSESRRGDRASPRRRWRCARARR